MAGGLNATGPCQLGSGLNVAGSTAIGGDLTVAGAVQAGGGVWVGPHFRLAEDTAGRLRLGSVSSGRDALVVGPDGREVTVGNGSAALLLGADVVRVAGALTGL